jgi:antitoxin VapB
MPLFVKDDEVGALAARLASILKITKTEAVRRALLSELEREEAKPSIFERVQEFTRALRARGSAGQAADKTFIDSLYGDS